MLPGMAIPDAEILAEVSGSDVVIFVRRDGPVRTLIGTELAGRPAEQRRRSAVALRQLADRVENGGH